MRDALLAQDRTILYSLCNWGTDEVYTWANNTGNSWRMSNDIQRKFGSTCNCKSVEISLTFFQQLGKTSPASST